MPAEIVMFPPAAIALDTEILNHPRLIAILRSAGPAATMAERFAIIAAYCGMVLDGYYDEKQLEYLFEVSLKKLQEKGVIEVARLH